MRARRATLELLAPVLLVVAAGLLGTVVSQTLEIYVVSEDQGEVRQYRWKDGKFEKTVVAELDDGDISWNIQEGNF